MNGESFKSADNSGANYDEENEHLEGFGGELEGYYNEQEERAEAGYDVDDDTGEEKLDDWDTLSEEATTEEGGEKAA